MSMTENEILTIPRPRQSVHHGPVSASGYGKAGCGITGSRKQGAKRRRGAGNTEKKLPPELSRRAAADDRRILQVYWQCVLKRGKETMRWNVTAMLHRMQRVIRVFLRYHGCEVGRVLMARPETG